MTYQGVQEIQRERGEKEVKPKMEVDSRVRNVRVRDRERTGSLSGP